MDTSMQSDSGDASSQEEQRPQSVASSTPAPTQDSDQPSSSAGPQKMQCQVCNESSPSMRPGSMACEACKKFFMRNYDVTKKFQCDNGGKCLQAGSSVNRRSCQACRMERCIALGLSDKVRPPKPAIDLRFVPCAVCGASSTGYHFGILSCEGCKGFFRRTIKYELAKNFTCDTAGKCVIDPLRQKCKKCRFERCLSAGMSPTGSHIGRHTNAQRAETKREIERLQNEQKLLKAPIMVRQLKRGAAAAALSATGPSTEIQSQTQESNSSKAPVSPTINVVDPDTDVKRPCSRLGDNEKSTASTHLPTIPIASSPSASEAANSSFRVPPVRHDFEAIAEMFASASRMKVNSDSSPSQVDDATLAAAQSLMSIFGSSPSSHSSSSPAAPNSSATDVFQALSSPMERSARPESSMGNLAGISSFLARLNAQAANLSATNSPSSSASQPSPQDLGAALASIPSTSNALAGIYGTGAQLKSPGFDSTEENTRAAILRRIRMPVARSNFLWLNDSGADWLNIANLLRGPFSWSAQTQLRPFMDPQSLHSFIRMLDSDNLLSEPQIQMFPRSEWLIAQVTNAVRNLSHIKNLRVYFDPGWTAEECWRQGMVCFEHHTRYVLAFVRSLPGYATLSGPDRSTLFTQALFPLVVAQLSLDYDVQEREENFLSMDHVGRELMSLNFPPLRQLRRHIIDAGVGIKTARLNIVEFGLICALVFFNTEVPNIVDADKVRTINEELRLAASIFISRTHSRSTPNPIIGGSTDMHMSPAEERLRLVSSHVNYLSSLFHTHCSLMADFARLFPHLINANPLHLELYNHQEAPRPPMVPSPPLQQ